MRSNASRCRPRRASRSAQSVSACSQTGRRARRRSASTVRAYAAQRRRRCRRPPHAPGRWSAASSSGRAGRRRRCGVLQGRLTEPAKRTGGVAGGERDLGLRLQDVGQRAPVVVGLVQPSRARRVVRRTRRGCRHAGRPSRGCSPGAPPRGAPRRCDTAPGSRARRGWHPPCPPSPRGWWPAATAATRGGGRRGLRPRRTRLFEVGDGGRMVVLVRGDPAQGDEQPHAQVDAARVRELVGHRSRRPSEQRARLRARCRPGSGRTPASTRPASRPRRDRALPSSSAASVAMPMASRPRSSRQSASATPEQRVGAPATGPAAAPAARRRHPTASRHRPDASSRSASIRLQRVSSDRNRDAGMPRRPAMKSRAAMEGLAWPFSRALMYALVYRPAASCCWVRRGRQAGCPDATADTRREDAVVDDDPGASACHGAEVYLPGRLARPHGHASCEPGPPGVW